ncbi:hypothetical protein CHS0354_026030 [Potamilus streckersoni]|uniref:Transmembrane protein n=1 Tax=Potamilus streckersoni TaxID=2493646 RepID=A0AAE0SBA2_9BIVA|nr:hypothetical protein CHS0354_026030 [Potamilus streckersoni]
MELKSFKAFNHDGQIKVMSESSTQENPDALNDGCCTHKEQNLRDFLAKHSGKLRNIRNIILFLLYIAYFSYAMYFRFGDEGSWRLLVCTSLGVLHLSMKLLRRRKRVAENLARGRRRKLAVRM